MLAVNLYGKLYSPFLFVLCVSCLTLEICQITQIKASYLIFFRARDSRCCVSVKFWKRAIDRYCDYRAPLTRMSMINRLTIVFVKGERHKRLARGYAERSPMLFECFVLIIQIQIKRKPKLTRFRDVLRVPNRFQSSLKLMHTTFNVQNKGHTLKISQKSKWGFRTRTSCCTKNTAMHFEFCFSVRLFQERPHFASGTVWISINVLPDKSKDFRLFCFRPAAWTCPNGSTVPRAIKWFILKFTGNFCGTPQVDGSTPNGKFLFFFSIRFVTSYIKKDNYQREGGGELSFGI